MSTKVEQLLRAGGANMANSLGQGAPKPAPALAAVSTGADRYAGRTKGNGGEMAVANIIPDPDQPRTEFDEAELQQLAESLKTHGQLQPIRVRWSQGLGKWVVIAGERRYRAAKLAGLTKLACVFVETEMSADVLLEEQLVENAVRSDLKPIEQARAYRRLMDMKGYNGKQVAERLQIHATSVTRALQLLDLPEQVQAHIDEGTIAPSVGVELSKMTNPVEQVEVAGRIVSEGMTRAEATAAVKTRKAAGKGRGKGGAKKAAPVRAKSVTFKTKDRCAVTLSFKKPPTDDDIRRALVEILDGLDQQDQAAA